MKFFCLPNLATDHVTMSESPWSDFPVDLSVLDLPKDDYKKRWFSPDTKHCLFLLSEGQNPAFAVSQGNQCAAIHGFVADYDGVFTTDIIDALRNKAPSRFLPRWWCLSQSKKLHLVWTFDRPITVTGNAHANELLHVIATKIKAVRWGVGYDPESELVTQVMDIGREWHEFSPRASIPVEEIIMWDAKLFETKAKSLVTEIVDIPFETAVEELKRRKWPHALPQSISIGVRCLRFWDPEADNSTGAQFVKDGLRVYTPHDGGFKSWKSLLGAEFCEQYTAKSMAPFYEDTFYCHVQDTYWRFFRGDKVPHFEHRTEKTLKRDMVVEARLSTKPAKGEDMSEMDRALYAITRRNSVDAVAPVLYRPAGRIHVEGVGNVLNTSLITVARPASRLTVIEPGEVEAYPNLPVDYAKDPLICAWDNPFAVRGFPHIHRYLTALFMKSQSVYNSWAAGGFQLHNTDGSPRSFLKDPQLMHLNSWMSHFYWYAARQAEHPPVGTVLILAGPASVGKSFFGTQILGRLMGGWTDASKMYLEGVKFNGQMAAFPVHIIDDKLGSRSQRERLRFTEALKVVAANGKVRCEEKYKTAVESLPWPGRIVILSNVDSQSLSVLPDLDMSTRDKFTMLRLGGVKYGFGTTDENQVWLTEELPAFARFLLGWHIPSELRDDRFGVRAVQHSDMAQASAENGLTQILVEVLETCIEETMGVRDPKEATDAGGWAVVGNSVKVFKWIKSIDDALAREVIDSRTLQQNLLTLYKNGGYDIAYDEKAKRWSIPYVLRKRVDKEGEKK